MKRYTHEHITFNRATATNKQTATCPLLRYKITQKLFFFHSADFCIMLILTTE